MNSSTLKELLTQYERKKASAEYEAEIRKQELFKKYPNLQELEDKLNFLNIYLKSNKPVYNRGKSRILAC